jgi:hypothetical protein
MPRYFHKAMNESRHYAHRDNSHAALLEDKVENLFSRLKSGLLRILRASFRLLRILKK